MTGLCTRIAAVVGRDERAVGARVPREGLSLVLECYESKTANRRWPFRYANKKSAHLSEH